ncbi:MAG: hypothetical protein FWE40_04610 [Oscillospiraceae bacterium]|nr:hypothetical protein [Oscillospiraceae bacterium]
MLRWAMLSSFALALAMLFSSFVVMYFELRNDPAAGLLTIGIGMLSALFASFGIAFGLFYWIFG